MAAAYIDNLPYINNGEAVEAGVANRVVQLLKANTDYLKGRLDAITTNEYVAALSRPARSDTIVGQPVYYNPANARFEPAQATTGKYPVVGLILNKPTATLADVITSGAVSLDITPVLASGDTLSAGRYYLSSTVEGKLTKTAPTSPQIAILYADGVGRIYVQPVEILPGAAGPTGPQGPIGTTGPAGAVGPQGPVGPTSLKYAQLADTTVTNTATETSLVAPGGWGQLVIGANTVFVGKVYKIRARGRISSAGLPTLNIRFKLGNLVLLATGNNILAANPNNGAWSLDVDFVFRGIGTGGSVVGQGIFLYDHQTNNNKVMGLAMTAPVVVDTTASQTPGITAQWGAADPNNSITCTNFLVEAPN